MYRCGILLFRWAERCAYHWQSPINYKTESYNPYFKILFLWWLLVAFFFVKAKEVKNCACICYCCYDSCLCPVLTIIFWIAPNWGCNINGYVQREEIFQRRFLLSVKKCFELYSKEYSNTHWVLSLIYFWSRCSGLKHSITNSVLVPSIIRGGLVTV